MSRHTTCDLLSIDFVPVILCTDFLTRVSQKICYARDLHKLDSILMLYFLNVVEIRSRSVRLLRTYFLQRVTFSLALGKP